MTPRRRLIRHAIRATLASAAAAFSMLPMGQAFASGTWSQTLQVSAIGQAAVIPVGHTPTATVASGAINLVWEASTFKSGREVGGYIVNRSAPDGSGTVQVCTVAAPARACQDTPAAGQQVIYAVVGTDALWKGPASPPTAPLAVPAAPAAPAAAAISALLGPSPSPIPAATPSPTPTPTAMPTTTPSPTQTPTATPSSSPSPSPSTS